MGGAHPIVARQGSWPAARAWLIFALQCAGVAMIQLGNDIYRGNLNPPNATQAFRNADAIVHFERVHGFFVEPGIQMFFKHSPNILDVDLNWSVVMFLANGVYTLCQTAFTAVFAVWIFALHRDRFPLVRNIILLTNVFAVIGYELYPLAPPRLLGTLPYDGQAFHFQDTMQHIIGNGKLNGTPLGYNPLSAMPSLHIAWALIVGATVIALSHHVLLRLIGATYPFAVTFSTVVTGNHYLMDGVGGVAIVVAAVGTVVAIDHVRSRAGHPRPRSEQELTSSPG